MFQIVVTMVMQSTCVSRCFVNIQIDHKVYQTYYVWHIMALYHIFIDSAFSGAESVQAFLKISCIFISMTTVTKEMLPES